MIAFKFLRAGRVARFSGVRWPAGGSWLAADGPLEPCVNGIHACPRDALAYWLDEELWTVELDGEITDGETVLIARRGRLLEPCASWPSVATELAVASAERARRLSERAGGDARIAALAQEATDSASVGTSLEEAVARGLCGSGRRRGVRAGRLLHRTSVPEPATRAAEWLLGLTSAVYLEYDGGSGRDTLPPEHALALAQEDGPFFVGGAFEMLPEFVRPIDELAEAFRAGGGVPQASFDPRIWEGMERFTAGWFENYLVPEWIPAMPDVEATLRAGGTLADIGCGGGRAVIKLAQALPDARFVGYDALPGQVERARENVALAGLADRVRIEQLDGAAGLPETCDVGEFRSRIRPKSSTRSGHRHPPPVGV